MLEERRGRSTPEGLERCSGSLHPASSGATVCLGSYKQEDILPVQPRISRDTAVSGAHWQILDMTLHASTSRSVQTLSDNREPALGDRAYYPLAILTT